MTRRKSIREVRIAATVSGMPLNVTCPRCGLTYGLPANFVDVTFQDIAGPNFVVPCPRCGHEWDLTGGVDGTYSTDASGNLRLVARLASSTRDELEMLREQLAKIAAKQDRASAVLLAQEMGWRPPEASRSRLTTGNEALDFVVKLSIVIGILLKTAEWTTEAVQHLVAQWFG